MERNFETVMIEQCAPVLASLKPAGLFRYETRDCADLARRVKNWNEQLQPKGLRVRVLKGCARTHQYLVYVYRESMLRAVLTDETVQGFLRQEGYHLPAERADCTAWLTQLSRRLCCSAEFPHEIGVFEGQKKEYNTLETEKALAPMKKACRMAWKVCLSSAEMRRVKWNRILRIPWLPR